MLTDERVSTPFKIYDLYFKEISTGFIIGLILLGFIVGIIIDQFSGLPFRKLRKKIEPEYVSKSHLTPSQKYALIRELSPTNFYHIENWHVYKGMCDNLSFGFLFLIVISIYKILISDERILWIELVAISIISIISLLSKANRFNQWAKQDIDSVIDSIDEIIKKRK